jgi:DNA replication protein DnaC
MNSVAYMNAVAHSSSTDKINPGIPTNKGLESFSRFKREIFGNLKNPKHYDFENFSLDFYSKTETADGVLTEYEAMSLVLKRCREFVENFREMRGNLLLTGETGLGKTHLSVAIGFEVISKGFGVSYASSPNMVSQLEKEKFGSIKNYESEEKFKNCSLLIIDDLGAEYTAGFWVPTIYNILNTRLMRGKSTIISTNLTMSEIQSIYGNRVVSRIIGNYKRIPFYGADIRQKLIRRR